MTTSDIPCTIFLPVSTSCSGVSVSFYLENNFLETREMGEYTPFYCNTTFEYTELGTYVFNYSTLDTGSIILEEDIMLDIFHLAVYGLMGGLGLIFMLFMHLFKDDSGSSIIYGIMASALFAIIGAMLVSGFELIKGVTFFFDINYYLIALAFILTLYNATVSMNLWKIRDKPEVSPYD